MILFGPRGARADAGGGHRRDADRGHTPRPRSRLPSVATVSSDGRRFLFFVALGQRETNGVYLGSLDGGEPTRRWGDTATMCIARISAACAARGYSLPTGSMSSAAWSAPSRCPLSRSWSAPTTGRSTAHFRLPTRASLRTGLARWPAANLSGVDRTGKVTGVLKAPDDALLATPQLAPDERRVAVSRAVETGTSGSWRLAEPESKFTFDPAVDAGPVWSPDGSRIVPVCPTGVWSFSRNRSPKRPTIGRWR